MSSAVTLTGIEKSFGSSQALRGLDLMVEQQSICGIIGPNGAGKSTAMRIILGLLRADAGTRSIFGTETISPDKCLMGYLPEERGIYGSMRVMQAIAFFSRLQGVSDWKNRSSFWIRRFGLTDDVNTRIEALSKGTARKVQILVAIIAQPRLLILDEPFSALDPVSVDHVIEIFSHLRDQGCSIVLSTHDMSAAELVCDSVVMICDGKQVLAGSVETIRDQADSRRLRIKLATARTFSESDLRQFQGVLDVTHSEDNFELLVSSSFESGPIMRYMSERAEIVHWELHRPTLHEIFVSKVHSIQ
jgi:ABC-2 type transport system ATP-binding protein